MGSNQTLLYTPYQSWEQVSPHLWTSLLLNSSGDKSVSRIPDLSTGQLLTRPVEKPAFDQSVWTGQLRTRPETCLLLTRPVEKSVTDQT